MTSELINWLWWFRTSYNFVLFGPRLTCWKINDVLATSPFCYTSLGIQTRIIMLENFLREYNINRILLSITGLWPFQNKLVRNVLWTFCFLLEISYYPFEVICIRRNISLKQLLTISVVISFYDFDIYLLSYDINKWI